MIPSTLISYYNGNINQRFSVIKTKIRFYAEISACHLPKRYFLSGEYILEMGNKFTFIGDLIVFCLHL